ncbi:TetR family transcriptional regulator [Chelatococcus reniformis]|uniref:TetR family transcriptional regulator n=1 Tax=Chelatococcus reniformis TaxID=1494448 RepID=A0A916UPP8_9HYPH|nr:TetR family transcriptional regulator [Chelatococcus reniformis]
MLEQAARLFRERGLDAPSVADLMRAAGMTHGGFYNHFASKAELQAGALALTFEHAVERLDDITAAPPGPERQAALRRYVERYLSLKARDAAGAGCPMVAFSADVSREEEGVRAAYAAGLGRYITRLTAIWSSAPAGSAEAVAARRRALTLLAPLVGGLSLARSVAAADPAFSDAILGDVREGLIEALDALLPAGTDADRT